MYDGYAAGGYYSHTGSGTNYLCLPKDPLHEPDIASGSRARIYGAEYSKQLGFKNNLHNHDVPGLFELCVIGDSLAHAVRVNFHEMSVICTWL